MVAEPRSTNQTSHGIATIQREKQPIMRVFSHGAIAVKAQKTPRQLDHAATDPTVAGPRQPLLARRLPRQASRSSRRHCSLLPRVAREDLMHRHVRRVDADPDDPRNQANHGARPLWGTARLSISVSSRSVFAGRWRLATLADLDTHPRDSPVSSMAVSPKARRS
jgi:hypothetical protein